MTSGEGAVVVGVASCAPCGIGVHISSLLSSSLSRSVGDLKFAQKQRQLAAELQERMHHK